MRVPASSCFLFEDLAAAQMATDLQSAGVSLALGSYSPTAYNPSFAQAVGPDASSVVLNQPLALYQGQDASSIPWVAEFDQWYQQVDPGASPDIYAAYGWLSGYLFAQGLLAGGTPTRDRLLAGLRSISEFDGGGMVAPDDPAAKTPPSCYLLINVANATFVRSPADPATGFDCTDAPDYYQPGS